MSRIISQHGNVIAADFGQGKSFEVAIAIKSETLYLDGAVRLLRTTAMIGEKPLMTMHFLGDLSTGHIVQLNNKDVTP